MRATQTRRGFMATTGGTALALGSGWLPLPSALADTSNPLFAACELLGRPTDRSVVVNMRTATALEVYFEYGIASGNYTISTPPVSYAAQTTLEVVLGGLQPNTRYFYRTRYRAAGQPTFAAGPEYSFHTQRAKGASFVVTVTADPHPNDGSDPAMYERTLGNAALGGPDFHFDLGDTFMGDKLPAPITSASVEAATLNHRPWHEIVGRSAPVFLGLGNHEGEAGWVHDGTLNNLSAWALRARKIHYPNPVPDAFYSGNSEPDALLGAKENYYAFEWGDTLFTVLDPYWSTLRKPSSSLNEWDWSLGLPQYLWLKHTLEQSRARYKIILTHHLVGGNPNITLDKDKLIGRGGIEAAPYGEWGGKNLLSGTKDTWGWDTKRPAAAGWTKPVHQLLVDNNVRCVLHGHDHVYVKQELDGIIYLSLPQPANLNISGTNSAVAGGYVAGTILPNSGHVRLSFSAARLTVDYIRTYTPAQETATRVNGAVGHTFDIAPIAVASGLQITRQPDRTVLTWNADPTVSYIVQWSTDMVTWHDVLAGRVSTWTDMSPALSKKFYRVTS